SVRYGFDGGGRAIGFDRAGARIHLSAPARGSDHRRSAPAHRTRAPPRRGGHRGKKRRRRRAAALGFGYFAIAPSYILAIDQIFLSANRFFIANRDAHLGISATL